MELVNSKKKLFLILQKIICYSKMSAKSERSRLKTEFQSIKVFGGWEVCDMYRGEMFLAEKILMNGPRAGFTTTSLSHKGLSKERKTY